MAVVAHHVRVHAVDLRDLEVKGLGIRLHSKADARKLDLPFLQHVIHAAYAGVKAVTKHIFEVRDQPRALSARSIRQTPAGKSWCPDSLEDTQYLLPAYRYCQHRISPAAPACGSAAFGSSCFLPAISAARSVCCTPALRPHLQWRTPRWGAALFTHCGHGRHRNRLYPSWKAVGSVSAQRSSTWTRCS